MDGEPVTWAVKVEPETVFSYWPEKTANDGSSANLQAALMTDSKREEEARRWTVCEVFSLNPLASEAILGPRTARRFSSWSTKQHKVANQG